MAVDAPKGGGKRKTKSKWWQQRWVVPIALLVLILAAFAVGALVNADRSDTASGGGALGSEPPASAPAANAAPVPAEQSAEQADEQPDAQTAKVCDRIVASQQDITDGGVEPLDAINELSAIEREARGTALATQVNNAAETMQQAVFGQADIDDVYAAVRDLATTCTG